MKAKGVIRDVLSWESSREYFHWRIRRRVTELKWAKEFQKADENLSIEEAVKKVEKIATAGGASASDDKAMAHAYEAQEKNIENSVKAMQQNAIERQIKELQAKLKTESLAM